MRSHLLVGAVAAFRLLDAVSAAPFPGVVVERQEDLHAAYDYVIVGGGTAGLTVANRLSEDEDKTVLVIEAGPLLGDKQDEIVIPGFSGTLGTAYQWNLTTQPISSLKDNGTFVVPSFKAVGGTSALDSMSFDRGSREDYDSWERLGNKGWGFDSLLPYFRKCETFYPPTKEQAEAFGITYDPKAHGTDGPVQVSYPAFIYPQYRTVAGAWKKFGVPVPFDATNGNGVGSLWIQNPIDPKDQTRSYARTAYHDKAVQRKNYHLVVEHQVTKILFDKHKRAIGVAYAKGPKDTVKKVSAKREVILSTGAYFNPKLLQLSGIGPKALLEEHKIPVIVDLPGVGSNLQDHTLVRPLNYTSDLTPTGPWIDPTPVTNRTWLAEALAEYRQNRTGYYTRPLSGSTVAFIPLPVMAPKTYRSIISASRKRAIDAYLPGRSSASVIAGYKAQKEILLRGYATSKIGVGEVSIRPGIAPGPALIVEKPLSRGYVEIASSDPWADPKLYYRTLSDPTDVAVLTSNLRFSRAFFASKGMAGFKPVETYPGANIDSDDELAEIVRGRIVNPSVGHASCTCPMMKRELGGVVDTELNVYGVTGLRIVDISIIPIIPTCHLLNTRYAIAEKAADIIRGRTPHSGEDKYEDKYEDKHEEEDKYEDKHEEEDKYEDKHEEEDKYEDKHEEDKYEDKHEEEDKYEDDEEDKRYE